MNFLKDFQLTLLQLYECFDVILFLRFDNAFNCLFSVDEPLRGGPCAGPRADVSCLDSTLKELQADKDMTPETQEVRLCSLFFCAKALGRACVYICVPTTGLLI